MVAPGLPLYFPPPREQNGLDSNHTCFPLSRARRPASPSSCARTGKALLAAPGICTLKRSTISLTTMQLRAPLAARRKAGTRRRRRRPPDEHQPKGSTRDEHRETARWGPLNKGSTRDEHRETARWGPNRRARALLEAGFFKSHGLFRTCLQCGRRDGRHGCSFAHNHFTRNVSEGTI